jgi:hypothetical protein
VAKAVGLVTGSIFCAVILAVGIFTFVSFSNAAQSPAIHSVNTSNGIAHNKADDFKYAGGSSGGSSSVSALENNKKDDAVPAATVTASASIAVSSANNIYYVSTSGSNSNDGLSTTSPIKTLSKINSLSLKAGDSVLFKRGDIWREPFKYIGASGEASSPITFGAYGEGTKPKFYGSINGDEQSFWKSLGNNRWESEALFPNEIFQMFHNTNDATEMGQRRTSDAALSEQWDFYWSSKKVIVYSSFNPADAGNGIVLPEYDAYYQSLIYMDSKQYLVFHDIEIDYTRYRALEDHNGNYNEFSNIDFKYGYEKALWLEGDNVIADGNTFYLCGIRGQPTPYGLDSQGENIWATGIQNPIIKNNNIEGCGGVCINLWHTTGGEVSDNKVINCKQSPTDWSAGIYLDGCNNAIIKSNKVSNCQIGIQIGAEVAFTSSHDITVSNNICKGNVISEFVINSQALAISNIDVSHNTFYKDSYTAGSGFGYEIFLKKFDGVKFNDNIVYNDYPDTGVGQLLLVKSGSNLESDNNLWYSSIGRNHFDTASGYYNSFASYQTGTKLDNHSISINPNFNSNLVATGTACSIGAMPC